MLIRPECRAGSRGEELRGTKHRVIWNRAAGEQQGDATDLWDSFLSVDTDESRKKNLVG